MVLQRGPGLQHDLFTFRQYDLLHTDEFTWPPLCELFKSQPIKKAFVTQLAREQQFVLCNNCSFAGFIYAFKYYGVAVV